MVIRDPRHNRKGVTCLAALTTVLIISGCASGHAGEGDSMDHAADAHLAGDAQRPAREGRQSEGATGGLPASASTQWRHVRLPDADTRDAGIFLDLASGKLIDVRRDQSPGRMIQHLVEQKRGDVLYDDSMRDDGEKVLGFTVVRGGKAKPFDDDRLTPGPYQAKTLHTYILPSVPARLLVTTAESRWYLVELLDATPKYLDLRYKPVNNTGWTPWKAAASDNHSVKYDWRIEPARSVRIVSGLTIQRGKRPMAYVSSEPGGSVGSEQPRDLILTAKREGDDLVLIRSVRWGPGKGDAAGSSSLTGRYTVSENTTFRMRWHKTGKVELDSDHYQTLWEGQWRCDGKTVKALRYLARLVGPNEPADGQFVNEKGELAKPVVPLGRASARHPLEKRAVLRHNATALIHLLVAHKFDVAAAMFSPEAKEIVPEAEMKKKLEATWRKLGEVGGKFHGLAGQARVTSEGGYGVVYLPARWEHNRLDFKVVFDKQGQVAGLWTVAPKAGPEERGTSDEGPDLKGQERPP